MSTAAVVAAGCCCTDNPCDCATTAFTVTWSGHIRLKGDCDECDFSEGGEDQAFSADAQSPGSVVVVQSRIDCKWYESWQDTQPIVRCNDDETEFIAILRIDWTLEKVNILGTFYWSVQAIVYRNPFGTGAASEVIAILSWITTTGNGNDCPTTGVAFAFNGTAPATDDACWSITDEWPIYSFVAGTVTLS